MAATSIVIELQRLATDGQSSVTELLRKALLIATKLKIDDFKKWIESELNGYQSTGASLPDYRMLRAEIKAHNPFYGWQPCGFQDSEFARNLALAPIGSPISEVERLATGEGMVSGEFPAIVINLLRSLCSDPDVNLRRFISTASLSGVLDRVRNTILEWSLRLEHEGILGDGMSFSDEDKQKAAHTASIHIGGDFKGVLGNVSGENLQIGDYGSIHQQLKDAGIPQAERNELENIFDELRKAKPDEKKSWAQKGMDWLGKNATNLGSIAGAIRVFFMPHLPPGQE